MTKGCFVLGASRCGSTMLSQMLRTHPVILSLSELITNQATAGLLPGPVSGPDFWARLSTPGRLQRKLANPDAAPDEFLYHRVPSGRFDPYACPPILAVTLPHLFDDPDSVFDRLELHFATRPLRPLADHYHALFHWLAAETGRRHWVERSGGSLVATQTLAREFPEARFVILLRDGRDVALSMQHYLPARMAIWFWKKAASVGLDVLAHDAHIGRSRWIDLAARLGGRTLPIDRILATEPSLRDCARFWSALTRNGLAAAQQIAPDQRLVLHFDDLVHDPRGALMRLMRFLDEDAPAGWIESAARVPRIRRPRRLDLSDAEQGVLTDETADVEALQRHFVNESRLTFGS